MSIWTGWFVPTSEAKARIHEILQQYRILEIAVLAAKANLSIARTAHLVSELEYEGRAQRFTRAPRVTMVRVVRS